MGRVTVQTVSSLPFTAAARVRSQISPCEIYGGKSGRGQGFLQEIRFFPVSNISPVTHIHLHLHVTFASRTNGRSLGTFQKNALSSIGEH
jgi:hypothetical protein